MKIKPALQMTATLLFVILAVLFLPHTTQAAQTDQPAVSDTKVHSGSRTAEDCYINPLYEDILTEADLKAARPSAVSPGPSTLDDTADYLTSYEEAGAQMREAMKKRTESITIYFQAEEFSKEVGRRISAEALAHTGVPTEGDYLKWQYGGWKSSISYYDKNDACFMTITYTVTYYTTASQEAEVDAAVADVLSSLNVTDKGDYLKIRAIYDYICGHTSYDHDNLEDTEYKLKYTAYAALIDGKAVCQGYALLFYRLALELDVDSRLIAGKGNGEAHGWNIVRLDGSYYNADTTWDAGKSDYSCFLKCEDDFTGHVRDEDYTSEAFMTAYPMGNENLTLTDSGTCGENLTWTLTSNGMFSLSGTGTMDASFEASGLAHQADIKNVYIYKDVTALTPGAFAACSHLKDFTVSSDNQAYTAVDGVLFTKDLKTLAAYPCGQSGEYVIPDGTAAVGEKAFHKSQSALTVIVPFSVKKIDAFAFGYMDGYLEKITFSGDAPDFDASTFDHTNTTICYPSQYKSWEDVRQTLKPEEGSLTWSAYSYVPDTPVISNIRSDSQTSVTISWNQAAGAEGYEIYRTDAPDTADETTDNTRTQWLHIKTITDGTLQYTDRDLTIGTTYYYRIRAFKTDGEGTVHTSDFSNISYMPAAVVFKKVYSNTSSRICLQWGEINGAHGYEIWQSNAGDSFKLVKTIGDEGNELTDDQGQITAYSNSGLKASRTYTYKIRAFAIINGQKIYGVFSDEYQITAKPGTSSFDSKYSRRPRRRLS